MSECREIRVKSAQMVYALFLKKNENGIDSNLQQSLKSVKEKFGYSPWIALLDLPSAKNQERLVEFAESRRCLLEGLNKLEGSKKNASHAHGTKNVFHLSLSHTTTHSAALVVLDNQSEFLGVGLDIELKNREIKPDVKAKFTFKSEEKLDLSALELWTIKEASFKANSASSGGSLFQYQIREYNSKTLEGKTARDDFPNQLTAFEMQSHENLLITVASARAVST